MGESCLIKEEVYQKRVAKRAGNSNMPGSVWNEAL
jgi:hypothetical protein